MLDVGAKSGKRELATLVGGLGATVIGLLAGRPSAVIGAIVMTGIAVLIVRVLVLHPRRPLADAPMVNVLLAGLTFVLAFLYAAVCIAAFG